MKKLVVLDLPFRSPAHVRQTLKIDNKSYGALTFDEARQLLTAFVASGEAELVCKFQLALVRKPGRHESALGDNGDLTRVRFGISVREQRKRARFARTMAERARAVKNGCDVAVESDLRLWGTGLCCEFLLCSGDGGKPAHKRC